MRALTATTKLSAIVNNGWWRGSSSKETRAARYFAWKLRACMMMAWTLLGGRKTFFPGPVCAARAPAAP